MKNEIRMSKSLRGEIEHRISGFAVEDNDPKDFLELALNDFVTWVDDQRDIARADYKMMNDMKGYRKLLSDAREAKKLLEEIVI